MLCYVLSGVVWCLSVCVSVCLRITLCVCLLIYVFLHLSVLGVSISYAVCRVGWVRVRICECVWYGTYLIGAEYDRLFHLLLTH